MRLSCTPLFWGVLSLVVSLPLLLLNIRQGEPLNSASLVTQPLPLASGKKTSLPDGVIEHLSAKARRFNSWADKVAYTRGRCQNPLTGATVPPDPAAAAAGCRLSPALGGIASCWLSPVACAQVGQCEKFNMHFFTRSCSVPPNNCAYCNWQARNPCHQPSDACGGPQAAHAWR